MADNDLDIQGSDTEDNANYANVEGGPSLANWKNTPTVRELKADYTEALPAHDAQMTKVQNWIDHLNIQGPAKMATKPGRSSVQPKVIRKNAEWRYASLSEPFLSTEDIFDVSPVTFEDKESAEQNQIILNNQFNTKLDKNRLIDDLVRAAVDEGTVALRVGWAFEEIEIEVEVPVFIQVAVTDPQEANFLAAQGLPPVRQVQTGIRSERQTKTVKNQPTLEVCDLDDIILDPTCKGDISKARFLINIIETDLAQLKRDGRYTNLHLIKLDNSSVLSEPDGTISKDSDHSFKFNDTPRQKFKIYEYWGFWDINDNGLVEPIVGTYVGDVMIRLEDSPHPDKEIPFTMGQMLPKRGSMYGEPDGALIQDNQSIIGAVTRGMVDVMGRSANSQIGIRKDALDFTNLRKFEKGANYQFNGNVVPSDAFHMSTYPEIPRSAQEMISLQSQEAESLTGVKAFSTGLTGQALGNTATGIRGTLDATSKRELAILRRLATCLTNAGRKIIAMNAQFLSEEETVRVTNDEFVKIRRDDLPGEFDLKLSISTAETDNEKAQELAFMLQTIGNSLDTSISQMILSEITKLRKMPALAKKIEDYQPEPNPLEVKKAELEVALLEAKVGNERAKAEENRVDALLKAAKTRNLDSKSDIDDLDFVSKQSGEDFAREIQSKELDQANKLDIMGAEALLKTNETDKS